MMPTLHELKRAVILAPESVAARYALAEAFFGEGQFAAAIVQLERARNLAKDDGNVVRLLARAYQRDGKAPRSQALLENWVLANPKDGLARDELIEMLLSQGRVDDALLHATEALVHGVDDVRRHLFLADLLRRRGLDERAREVLEAARERFPEDALVARDLKELLNAVGDAIELDRSYFLAQSREALRAARFTRMVEDTPLAPIVAAMLEGHTAAARRALGELSEVVRGTAIACVLAGELQLLDGAYDAAEERFRAALAQRADLGIAWNRLGDLAQVQHDLARAVTFYKKAILHDPDDANALEDLGDVHAMLGETERAARLYRRAAEKDPSGGAPDKLAALALPPVEVPTVGRIGVLGWHPTGGAVSPLEAVAVPGKGELILSGNLGAVAREAAQVAFSVLKTRAHELGIDGLVTGFDLHLHFTDTAIGKDGPSAGLALLLAGVSAYTQRPLKPRLAATGELTLHGQVHKVGGIHEKLVAARLAGIRTVILPKHNLQDARALPEAVTVALELVFVDSVADAIQKALAIRT